MDNSTKYFLAAVAAVVVIVGGLLLLSRESSDNPAMTYNGFVFENYGGLWHTEWERTEAEGNRTVRQRYTIRLNFNPKQVEDVPVTGQISERFTTSQLVFITHDPAEQGLGHVALATTEVSLALVNVFDRELVAACTRNETMACSNRPIVGCDNTNVGVIYFTGEGPAEVQLDDNCVILHGEGEEIVRAAEKAIYQWYGII